MGRVPHLGVTRERQGHGSVNSDEQKASLAAIRDHLAVNIEIRSEDMSDVPEFAARGGFVRARGRCLVRASRRS
jgi:type I restriction enzyme R subunit